MIMSDTLKARLEELCLLKERAKSLEVNVAESEWSDAKVRILKEFYSQNQLAYVVAGEKDSYKERKTVRREISAGAVAVCQQLDEKD